MVRKNRILFMERTFSGILLQTVNMGGERSRSEIETPILFLFADGLIEHVDLDFCEPNPHIVFCVCVAHRLDVYRFRRSFVLQTHLVRYQSPRNFTIVQLASD